MKKKGIWMAVGTLAGIVLFLILPPLGTLRSMAIMSVYSAYCQRDSIESHTGMRLRIPGGMETGERDWYPMTLFYDASEEFSSYIGEDVRLNIYYNFPAFDIWEGSSWLYDPDSPYYTSFYGAYLVEGGAGFGFDEEGKIDAEEAAQVIWFDLFRLVLDDFGLSEQDAVFAWEEEERKEIPYYANLEDWQQIDGRLEVNGAGHHPRDFCLSYLQYGKPAEGPAEAFAPVQLQGRMIGRYFEEEDVSLFFYILSGDPTVLEDCDRRILSHSQVICAN